MERCANELWVSTLLEIQQGIVTGSGLRRGEVAVSTLLEILLEEACGRVIVLTQDRTFQPFLRFNDAHIVEHAAR